MNVYLSVAIIIACIQLHFRNVVSTEVEGSVAELNSRIVGGYTANPTRYPYYTYLRCFPRLGEEFRCGGSLVNSDVVLTAAHCLNNVFDPIVKINVYVNYTQSIAVTWNLTEYVHVRQAISWIPHPKNNPFVSYNPPYDAGLIFLDKPVDLVAPIKLNSDADFPADGDPVTAIGHGYIDVAETPAFPFYLNEVSVPIVSFEDCNDSNSYSGKVTDETMICAGLPSGGKDSCFGDSGGPLLVAGSSAAKDILVGVTSWGEGCALKNFPGVYTRVSYFRKWIDTNICRYSKKKPTSCPKPKPPTKKPTKSMVTSRPTRKAMLSSTPTQKRI